MALKHFLSTLLMGTCFATVATGATSQPVVLELFTSQGCSSCPPADALLSELGHDPSLLPLSFHVDYWDRLGWTDPYSLPQSTDHQRRYAQWLGRNNVFTPQLMVNGMTSVNGADRYAVERAIANAKSNGTATTVTVRRDATGKAVFSLPAATTPARLLAVHYIPIATTHVGRGENGGRSLTSINNVTAIDELGSWQTTAQDYTLPMRNGEGVAFLLQENGTGHILGAAALNPL